MVFHIVFNNMLIFPYFMRYKRISVAYSFEITFCHNLFVCHIN